MNIKKCPAPLSKIDSLRVKVTRPFEIFRTIDSDRQIFGAVTSVMQFVVPFIIMAFAYTKVTIFFFFVSSSFCGRRPLKQQQHFIGRFL